ncbi:MAG: tetratricopeptide repeat protein [Acidimicrobiales bacterium]
MDPLAHLPVLHARWLAGELDGTHAEIDGALVFADVSGFTQLSERLVQQGKAGAEELTDIVNQVVGGLLDVAIPLGGDLLKFGGDALLLLFTDDGYAARAVAAAAGMQVAMRRFRSVRTGSGRVSLRMSIGAETGPFLLCLPGRDHRELVVVGPAVSEVAALEAAAGPGEVLIGPRLAASLPATCLGAPREHGILVRRAPTVEPVAPMVSPPLSSDVVFAGIPVGLRDHLRTTLDGEHRHAVVAFVHYQGTDDLLAASGPEALAEAIDELVTATQEACREHGVTFLTTDLDTNAGKILLIGGAPITLGDDDDRVVAVLRAVLEREHRLRVRAGVNRGRIFAAEVGTDARRVYSVTGDTVNLAARVMGRAPQGGCLATMSVVERLNTEYHLDVVEPFHVKGKRAPVSAALVGSVIGSRPGGVPVADTPLVGRAQERAVLVDAVADARAGTTRVIELIGEPGIGKSRLIAEMCAAASDLPVVFVEGSQYASANPYRAVRDAARSLLGLDVYENDGVVVERLTDVVRAVRPELEPWLPLLAIPFGVSLSDTAETAALAPANRRHRLQEVVSSLLAAVLPETGVLVVEDAYWLDEGSGELLAHLIRVLQSRLHWAVCVARRGVVTTLDLTDVPDVTRLELGPLPPQDAASLLLVGSRELAADEALALVERSGGNPLFLQELAAATVRGATMAELPDNVEALLAAHIDTLDNRDRRLLRTASVLGLRLPRELLANLAGDTEVMTAASIRRLGGLLLPDGAERVRFRHSLIREVAYEGLSFKRRRELHGRAAELIEAHAGDDPESAAEALSLHYFAAGRHIEAWHWSRVAGDRARRNAAPVEAAAFFERALESARHAGIEPAAVAETHEALGDVCELGGLYDRAAAAYSQARRLVAGDEVSVGNLCRKQGWVNERTGRYGNALRWYTRGFRAVESVAASAAAGRLKAELYLAYGAVRLRQGRHREAVPLLEEAVRQAEALEALPTLAHAYYDLDWAFTELGQPDPRYRELALPIYEELGDWEGQGNTLNNLGLGAYYEGRWDEARTSWQRAREAFEKAGDVVQVATIANNIGEILSDQGHLAEAEDEFHTALTTWTEAQFRVGVGLAISNLGRAAARAGRFDEAAALLASAIEQLQAIGARELALEAEARDAERCVLAGDHEQGIARAEAAHARATRPVLRAGIERTIGYAWAQRGELESARRSLQQSLATAEHVGAAFEIAQTRMALARVNGAAGELAAAAPADPEATAIFDRLAVVWTPQPPLPASGVPAHPYG